MKRNEWRLKVDTANLTVLPRGICNDMRGHDDRGDALSGASNARKEGGVGWGRNRKHTTHLQYARQKGGNHMIHIHFQQRGESLDRRGGQHASRTDVLRQKMTTQIATGKGNQASAVPTLTTQTNKQSKHANSHTNTYTESGRGGKARIKKKKDGSAPSPECEWYPRGTGRWQTKCMTEC